jgi:hypothetical protein
VRSEQPLGDLGGDCHVGVEDLLLLSVQWLSDTACSGPACPDLNDDDRVDLLDLALMAQNWDAGIPCR